ncbi:hypothetical protein V7128_11330 [Neobacillus vireti]|uniref:hypothetical protein n=1 Tax=Neobacillus vireti TaxID=220686 RepID=UPI002FFEAB65
MIMNHRNSQSGRENPFSKKRDGNTSNLSTNNVNDHPSPFNFSKMEQEEKNKPKVKKAPQRNQSLITGKIGDKIISIPLIYPPPKVESKQVKGVGKTPEQPVLPNNVQIEGTSVLEDVEQKEGNFGKGVSKGESEREGNVSLMEEEFSSLLEESPSLIKEPSLILETSSELTEESNPLINELFLMLDEESESNSPILEETESIDDIIAEKIIAILEEEDDDSFMEEITSLFEAESPPFHNENSLSLERESTVLVKENFLSLEEESTVSVKENLFSLEEESAPTEDTSLLLREESPSQLEWDSVSTKKEFTLFSEEDSLSVEEESISFREKNSISLEEESTHFLDDDTSLDNQSSTTFEEENAEPLKEESMAEKEKTFLFKDDSDLNFDESSSYQDEFSMMLEKAATNEQEDTDLSDKKKKEVSTKDTDEPPSRRVKENAQWEKSPSQSDKKGSDHEESKSEEKNAQQEKSPSQSDKNDTDNKEPKVMKKSSLLLEELYSQLEESSSHQSESDEIDYYKEEESPFLDDIFPKCTKGKKDQIEERFEEELLKEEESEDQCPSMPTEECKHECEQENGPTVKLPVLLAKLLVDINIFETVDLPFPIESVSKVEWSLQSYQCKVILPSTTVFLKGVLVADVEFKGDGMKTIQSMKIPVSWSKTTKVEWLHSPKMPNKSQKEYIFTSENGEDITTHYEFTQEFADEIDAEIRVVHFSINEEFHSCEMETQFDIQGSVTLSIDLLQEQFIHLK